MIRARIRQLIVTTAMAAVAPVTRAASATIYPLPIANNGSTGGRGYGINDAQQVAVTSVMVLGQGTAGLYDGVPGAGGVLRDLGALPGDQTAFALGINASGQVAGYSQGATVFTPTHAFRYDGTPGAGGVMRPLGSLGGASSQARGLNDLGQVTGDSQADPAGPTPGTYAFVYTGTPGTGGVMKSLGSLGGTSSSGAGINHSGQVAGNSTLAGDLTTHAFRYDGVPGAGGVMRDLGTLPGYTSSSAAAINAAGQVAGTLSTSSTSHAFIYKGTPGAGGAMVDLNTLPGGTFSSAVGINDAGFVVGFSDSSRPGDPEFYPALWRPDGSVVDLAAWLNAANPVLGAQWNLRDAFIGGISNTGLITGDGLYTAPGAASASERAFVLDASTLVVPEPTALALLLGANVLILARRKPRRRDGTYLVAFPPVSMYASRS